MNFPVDKIEKVLILGFGDLGSRLAKQLSPQNYQITGVCRSQRDQSHVQIVNLDLYQSESFTHLFQNKFDVIVITMTPQERSDQGYQQAYVQTCHYLLMQLQLTEYKPRLILFISSTSVYAQSNGEWIDETSPAEPISFNGKRLLEAEKLLQASSFPICIIRFSGIYGPGRDRLINQVKSGKLSASKSYTNRIHVEDCARVIAHLIKYQKVASLAPLYLASDNCPVLMQEVQAWLAKQMNVSSTICIKKNEEQNNKRISNTRLLNTGFEFFYPGYQQGYSCSLTEKH